MYRLLKILLVVSFCTSVSYGQVTFNPDEYIGGDRIGESYYNTDVIGSSSTFNITGWYVKQNGGSLNIKIESNYFGKILNNANVLNTQMGDLFISNNGLSGPSDTNFDYFKSSSGYTTWDYGVQLGKYSYSDLGASADGVSQTGNLFAFDDAITDTTTYENQIKISDDFISGTIRNDQEVRINSDSTSGSAVSWFITPTVLDITIDNFGSSLGLPTDGAWKLGFHWAMTCANDTIEFEVPGFGTTIVPEPSSVALLGAVGMLGLLFLRRRFIK